MEIVDRETQAWDQQDFDKLMASTSLKKFAIMS